MCKVCIVMGSESDRKIADRATAILDALGIEYETHVASAHRNPERVIQIVDTTPAKVFIAIAGLSAHLPGFIASRTQRPVVGVPVAAKLGGLDSLLSIVQMPKGVPVATVGIDRGDNGALLAARILSVEEAGISAKLSEWSP
jgi:5-(carboxyamino)imidazole ribonucleotide mutase